MKEHLDAALLAPHMVVSPLAIAARMNQPATATTSARVRIDFVSDVSCPWCAIGLLSLEQALARLDGRVAAEIHFQPFELNPDMPPGGQDTETYVLRKYGADRQQLARNREAIRQRGAALGFVFGPRERIYNTFDAHRLLHWAASEGRQAELKHALLRGYFTEGEDVGSREVLARIAASVGLPEQRAREVLASGDYGEAVRTQERFYQERGIHAVPAVIVNERHLISGGQPTEIFESALKQITGAA
jgi:predicted DsbA family dithiol-disulfide isomerase